jgi:hypothetical protein
MHVTNPPRIFVNWECDVICPIAMGNVDESILGHFADIFEIYRIAFNLGEVGHESGIGLPFANRLRSGAMYKELILYHHPPHQQTSHCFYDPFALGFDPFDEHAIRKDSSSKRRLNTAREIADGAVKLFESKQEEVEKRIKDALLQGEEIARKDLNDLVGTVPLEEFRLKRNGPDIRLMSIIVNGRRI